MLESLDISFQVLLVAVLVVTVGTAVQAAVGFGLAMIAAPVLILIDRRFVPAPLLVVALVLVVWMAWRDRAHIDRSTLVPALAGRLLGTPPAALMMGMISATVFDLVFGLMVLLAVGLSLFRGEVLPTRFTVFLAAMASGFMSTVSSIGGPPLALVYQNARGPALRANLSLLFTMGCVVSLTALWLVGRFTLPDLMLGAVLLVGVGAGLVIARPVRNWLDRRSVRPWLLSLCAFASLLVLGRALVSL